MPIRIKVLKVIETTDIPGIDSYLMFKVNNITLVGFLPEVGDYSSLEGKTVNARLLISSFRDEKAGETSFMISNINKNKNSNVEYEGKIVDLLKEGTYLIDCGFKLELATKNRYTKGEYVGGTGRLDVYIEP